MRSGHLAMVTVVVAAVAGTAIVNFYRLSAAHLAPLVATAAAYIGWSLGGTRGPVRSLLWEGYGQPPPPVTLPGWGVIPCFGIQPS